MRRLLFFLAGTTTGAGILLLFSAGTGAGLWLGIPLCALLTLGTAIGGRRGAGPVSRGVRAPYLTRAGMSVVALCALAAVLLARRPTVGAGLPMVPFLLCQAIGGLLLVPVGLMGNDPPT